MQIPLEWLKQYVPVEATAEEIATRLTMGGLEVEGIEESALGPVLDVYVTPNRGDCLSLVGVAREVAALYGLPLLIPTIPTSATGGETAGQTSVTIEDTELCPRYAARLVRGVKIGPSPAWMQARLEAVGQRPINNVVDVTNYVMLELGQPLHAFDLEKLAGQRIVVRRADEGERLQTLDGQEHTLNANMLVIADAEKAVAMAGLMGGASSEVSDETTNLLLESAHFNPLSVRRTSRALGLRTEASYRFERVVDPDGVRRAVDRACQLLAEMGQPEAISGGVDIYPHPATTRPLTLRMQRTSDILGMDITAEVASECLQRLGFGVEATGDDTLRIHVPTFRPDLILEEDLMEEVGRIYGYENIPETLPRGEATQGGESTEGKFIRQVKQLLAGCGLQEVVTHSLTAPFAYESTEDSTVRVPVRNSLSTELSGLRRSLLPTLLDVAQHNATQGGQQALALFEVGRVWHGEEAADGIVPTESLSVAGLLVGSLGVSGWQRDARPLAADFATGRGILDHLCQGLCLSEAQFSPLGEQAHLYPAFHPGRTALLRWGDGTTKGILGEIHPRLAAKLSLRERIYVFEIPLATLQQAAPADLIRYQPLARFPAVVRDLAPRVAEGLSYAAIEEAIRAADVALLSEVKLTDIYRGVPIPEGVKSLTLSFTFRSPERTLSEADITEGMARLRASLEQHCQAAFPA